MSLKKIISKAIIIAILWGPFPFYAYVLNNDVALAKDKPTQTKTDPKTPPEGASKSKSGMPAKPLYRPKYPVVGKEFDEARKVMDEVIKNGNGKDDFLNDKKWEKTDEDTERGKKWAAAGLTLQFTLIYGDFKSSLDKVDNRRRELEELNDKVEKKLKEKEKEFKKLTEGDDALMHILKGLGFKAGGFGLGKALEKGSKLMKKAHAGKLVGAAGTILGIYQFFLASDEYFNMTYILEDILELLELRAYLQGLIMQYNELYDDLSKKKFALEEAWLNRKKAESKTEKSAVPLHKSQSYWNDDAERGEMVIHDHAIRDMERGHDCREPD